MKTELIEEFVDKKLVVALDELLKTNKEDEAKKNAIKLADIFGTGTQFKKILDSSDDAESKLVSSFHNNLLLLIQKTWIEKSDEELKAQVIYQLNEFCSHLNAHSYTMSYPSFFNIVDDAIYLMFGSQTKKDDFDEYAMRIDPEFGIFWWYMRSLPREERWSESKSRIVILLGMYFLANF